MTRVGLIDKDTDFYAEDVFAIYRRGKRAGHAMFERHVALASDEWRNPPTPSVFEHHVK